MPRRVMGHRSQRSGLPLVASGTVHRALRTLQQKGDRDERANGTAPEAHGTNVGRQEQL
jgi:hypothetical protein